MRFILGTAQDRVWPPIRRLQSPDRNILNLARSASWFEPLHRRISGVRPRRAAHIRRSPRREWLQRVPFYTRNLYQSGDRIASQTQVMLDSHLRSILHLTGTPTQKLRCGGSRHSAGCTDLALTYTAATWVYNCDTCPVFCSRGSGFKFLTRLSPHCNQNIASSIYKWFRYGKIKIF